MKFNEYLKEFQKHNSPKKGRKAWEIVEEKHYEEHGKFKYNSYQSFKTMKSRKKNQKI
tara:strand:- start:79 stop:252 length:174 start_codon:yes stop_codon:yes gene_type:complete